MYLTFDDYEDYGGTITDETLYERLEYRARKHLDKVTMCRLQSATTISETVKRCMFELIGIMEKASGFEGQIAQGVSSVTNDGVSVSYQSGGASAQTINSVCMNICRDYLAGEVDANNIPLLYHGVEP